MGTSASKQDNPTSPVKSVAVIGAGVSGLAAAYKLKSHGLNVTVFEAEERAGGKLRSVSSHHGLIWDEGANTMTESEVEVQSLLDDLGIREKQQFPISQNKRYIVRNGLPVLIPTNSIALIMSNILSSRAKVVDYLIDPFVAGTSGGDPESLSMRHTFPELWNLENRFGSIITGLIQSKLFARKEQSGEAKRSLGKKKPQRGSFSFQGGMQTLADTLCKELNKDELKLNSKVLSLSYDLKGKSEIGNWTVSSAAKPDKNSLSIDAVIVTVTYVPLSVIISTFRKENIKRPLEGFGVLVPSVEQRNGLKTLGTLFSSMMFPDRAPSDLYLYTTFVGGSRNKELASASIDELKQVVTSDLKQLLGAEGEPTFYQTKLLDYGSVIWIIILRLKHANDSHFHWKKAFPLYGHNYDSVVEAIEMMEKKLPGFFYAGNHKGGLSVGKAIASGFKAAELVISYLESS
ncbi:Protoporphyrinogen oxidase [Morus notabilis]|uniref:Protoporphyrinogen oxidase n=1 Tax=Morus notabilis TaxID=981085 RepID=W9SIW4_9ROSA|nr:Protoporphyrinogen oxidase [Morus notabilis]